MVMLGLVIGVWSGGRASPIAEVKDPKQQAEGTFMAWDCENPQKVQSMALPQGCDMDTKSDGLRSNQPRAWMALQETTYFSYKATVCTMRRSSMVYSCAWKSHKVLATPPETYRKVRTQVGQCRYWQQNLRYTAPTGENFNLVGHGLENNIKVVTKGQIEVDNGYPHCQGVPFTKDGYFLYEGVEVQDVNIVLRTVTVHESYDTGHRQIVEDGHEIKEDAIHNGGAIGADGTYVFHRPEIMPCRHQIIKKIEAEMVVQSDGQMILVDEKAQIHMSAKALKHTPLGCPSTQDIRGYYSTLHGDITVVEVKHGGSHEGLVPIDPHQIHMGPFVDLKAEWLLHIMASKIAKVSNFQGNLKCQAMQSMWTSDVPVLHDDSEKLLLHRGEMLYAITCRHKTVILDQERGHEGKCYTFLPVLAQNGNGEPQRRFLTPGSRLLVNSSMVEDCGVAGLSPRGYRTKEGHWLAMHPDPVTLQSPATMDITLADLGMDRAGLDALGGPYGPDDLKAYSLSYEWPLRTVSGRSYAEQVVRALEHGNMWEENNQRSDMEEYFRSISDKMKSPLMSVWVWFMNTILPWMNMMGSACSIFVCLMGSAVSMIAVSQYIRDSKAHALVINVVTVLKILCCSPLAVMTDPNYRASIANYAVSNTVVDKGPSAPIRRQDVGKEGRYLEGEQEELYPLQHLADTAEAS